MIIILGFLIVGVIVLVSWLLILSAGTIQPYKDQNGSV